MSDNNPHLTRSLKNRHIQMIAFGGAIGTGLFYGSAESIQLVGPGIILAYLIGGVFIYWVMRMLGEMATHEPVSGSISHYAYQYWGEFPGFLSGWSYWLLYILVSMAELTVVGIYVVYWFPDFPAWASALITLVVITTINLINVRYFGETEFWLTFIKVAAIIGMIVLGSYLIFFGNNPNTSVANLWQHGGFLPNGFNGLFLAMVVVSFSFGGTELVGVTAGESDQPQKTIPKAINQIIWRILIFYIGTLTVLMILYPWNQIGKDGSPFVTIFDALGIPAAPHILNFVVLIAAISVYNSGMYSNGRMLYSLAQQGNAPRIFLRLNRHQIPYVGILFSSFCTLSVVGISYLFADGAFMRVMALATAALILTWLMIVITHLKFRQTLSQQGQRSLFRTPGYPWANKITIVFYLIVLAAMTQIDSTQLAVLILPVWIALLYIGYKIKTLKK